MSRILKDPRSISERDSKLSIYKEGMMEKSYYAKLFNRVYEFIFYHDFYEFMKENPDAVKKTESQVRSNIDSGTVILYDIGATRR